MKFSHKLFLTFFLSTLGLSAIPLYSLYSQAYKIYGSEFVARYEYQVDTLAEALIQWEEETYRILLNAASTINLIERTNGLPSGRELKDLASNLGIIALIANSNGDFIRSSIEDPATQPNLFSYCPKRIINNELLEEHASLQPQHNVLKFLVRPTSDKRHFIKVATSALFIEGTLGKAFRKDKNLIAIGLYTRTGLSLGGYNSNGEFRYQDIEKFAPPDHNISINDKTMTLFKKIAFGHPSSCASDLRKKLNENPNSHYVIKEEISLSELRRTQAVLRNGFLTLSALLFAIIIFVAHFLAQSLAEPVRRLMAKLDELGKDLIAFEKDRTLAQVARQVAHDIRSPLSAIRIVGESARELALDKRNLLSCATNRICEIAEELLKESKSPATTIERHRNCKIGTTLDEIYKEKALEFTSRSKVKLELIFQCSKSISVAIPGKVLKRILSNLINNSVDALDQGGKILLSLKSTSGLVTITVADNGRGIPQEILPYLGETEVSYGKSNSKESGSGLGLFHARKALAEFNSSMHIESTAGEGTQITLTLPIAQNEDLSE